MKKVFTLAMCAFFTSNVFAKYEDAIAALAGKGVSLKDQGKSLEPLKDSMKLIYFSMSEQERKDLRAGVKNQIKKTLEVQDLSTLQPPEVMAAAAPAVSEEFQSKISAVEEASERQKKEKGLEALQWLFTNEKAPGKAVLNAIEYNVNFNKK